MITVHFHIHKKYGAQNHYVYTPNDFAKLEGKFPWGAVWCSSSSRFGLETSQILQNEDDFSSGYIRKRKDKEKSLVRLLDMNSNPVCSPFVS